MSKTKEGDVILTGARSLRDLCLDISYEHERVGEKDDSGWEKYEVASKAASVTGVLEIPFEIIVNGAPDRFAEIGEGGPEFDVTKIRRLVESAIKEEIE